MIGKFDFGVALSKLRNGCTVARVGWNGKGMYLVLVEPHEYHVEGADTIDPRGILGLAPWIAMCTADMKLVPWLASQTDVLAVDWVAV